MLRTWFGISTPRLPTRERSFRPALEALEDRLPPSGMHGGGDGNHAPVVNNVHNNIHISDSFNGQNVSLLALPPSTLQGFFTTLYKQAAAINAPAANALVADEAQLAVDAFLSLQGIPGLSSPMSSLQSAIASNPLSSSPVGMLMGDLAFDIVLQGLVL